MVASLLPWVAPGLLDQLLRGRQLVGLMAQGFQRRLSADGRVLPLLTPSPQLLVGGWRGEGATRVGCLALHCATEATLTHCQTGNM